MRTFVLGAGASLHVGYPLTGKLGIELVEWVERNPQPHRDEACEVCGLFPSLDDFEEVISELQDPKPGSRVHRLPEWKRGSILAGIREALADYFDTFCLCPAPLYQRLAELVRPRSDTVITFNYDVSLEGELRKAGKWQVGDGYGFLLGDGVSPPSPMKVLKLHGSTSWVDILFGGARGGDHGAMGSGGPLGVRPLILPHYLELFGYSSGTGDPMFVGGSSRHGSMILPARSKVFDARQLFWDSLWAQASDALRSSTEIVIIGYRLAPADKRARDLLLQAGNRQAAVSVCCGGETARIAQELATAGFAQIEATRRYFHEWLEPAE